MKGRKTARKMLFDALKAPLQLSVAASAGVGAVAMHSWPVLALGGLTYAALVAYDLLQTGPKVSPRPELDKLDDPDAVQACRAVSVTSSELVRVLADTPQEVRAHLGSSIASLAELEERATALLVRVDSLSRYLASIDLSGDRAGAERLSVQARSARDVEARTQYQLAHDAAQERLTAVEDIARARERALASVAQIASTISSVSAKLVRMRALDEQAQDALGGDISRELSRVNVELKAFEETLEALEGS